MSAANAANTQVRRPVPPQRPVAPTPRAAAPANATVADFDHDEDEFVLNLSDIPRMRTSLHVDGLKPSLLSRLFDLIAPIKA